MRDEYAKKGATPYLTGFELNLDASPYFSFNVIMSNGDRSRQRDKGKTFKDKTMSEGVHKKIRSVRVHYDHMGIRGFSFFDVAGVLMWEVGYTTYGYEEVLIADGEVIVGVLATLYLGY